MPATELPHAALRQTLSKAITAIRARSPFFGTLLLHTDVRLTDRVRTAATDGAYLFFNPKWSAALDPRELMGVLVHEVLHAALLHVQRRGAREAHRWNIACDIVVNALTLEAGFRLPEGAIIKEELAALRAEEVYAALPPTKTLTLTFGAIGADLQESAGQGAAAAAPPRADHWKQALRQAAGMHGQLHGRLPEGIRRRVGHLTTPRVDWRTALWRFATRTPTDFQGFDRRFVHQRLYLEELSRETLHLRACIDTSGSIREEELGQFLSELQGIARTYPHVDSQLFYADAGLYGPYSLDEALRDPAPQGGGGTSFVPFFDHLDREDTPTREGVAVYFTDLYGDFPQPPSMPTLWVVPSGGAPSETVPFGEVVRLGEG